MIIAIKEFLDKTSQAVKPDCLPDWYECFKCAIKELQLYPNGKKQPLIFESSLCDMLCSIRYNYTQYDVTENVEIKDLYYKKYIQISNLFSTFLKECKDSGFVKNGSYNKWFGKYQRTFKIVREDKTTQRLNNKLAKIIRDMSLVSDCEKLFYELNEYLEQTEENKKNWLMLFGIIEYTDNFKPIKWCGDFGCLAFMVYEFVPDNDKWEKMKDCFVIKNKNDEYIARKSNDYAQYFKRFKDKKDKKSNDFRNIIKKY